MVSRAFDPIVIRRNGADLELDAGGRIRRIDKVEPKEQRARPTVKIPEISLPDLGRWD